jgi:uncharacterized RDD family membrane protein YckC
MTQELAILTPEKAIVGYKLASVGSRGIAHLIDWIVIAAIYVLGLFAVLGTGGTMIGALLILVYLGWAAYFILFEGLWNGQTLGKRAMGIRVRMADGTAITFVAAIGRNFLRFADFVPAGYMLGMIAMFTNPKSQRIGDLASGTIVVLERRGEPRFSPAPYVLGIHPMEEAIGDLRGMSQEEYVALKQLCDRFPELPATVQSRLIRDVWKPIAIRRAIPDLPGIHPIFLAEATVMKYGRERGML